MAVEDVIINVEETGADETAAALSKVAESLDAVAEEMKTTRKEGEAYNKTLGDTIKEQQVFGVSLGGIQRALGDTIKQFRNSVRGMKIFSTAMKAIPIFALIAAFSGLASFLTKTQKGNRSIICCIYGYH
jgi:hypothetical protein